jgi:prephenate dehydrogenase/chorismate mutase
MTQKRGAGAGSNIKRYKALDDVRRRIDEVDVQLAALLAERLALSGEIADVKAELNISIKDPSRENEVLTRVGHASSDADVAKAICQIYETIFSCSRNVQTRRKAKKKREPLFFPQVTIVGMGLIGGVMARLIRERVPQTIIIGVDIDERSLHEAVASNLIDRAELDGKRAVRRSQLVILAASPDANLKLMSDLGSALKRRQLLIDVGSVKSPLVSAVNQAKLTADFVGGHPLFGSERSGLSASANVNTEAAVFCVTPSKRSSEMSLRRLIRWLSGLGLNAMIVDADKHDRVVATTSHLVQLLSVAVGAQLAKLCKDAGTDTVGALCGPSVRQLFRLMSSPSDLWLQIIDQNRAEIASALQALSTKLSALSKAVADGDKQLVQQAFETARAAAAKLAK